MHRRDQYDRVVGTAWVRRPIFLPLPRKDVGLEMLRAGLATVYEASFGVEFGGFEKEYRQAEKVARDRKTGMWTQPGLLQRILSGGQDGAVETPRAYKTRMQEKEKEEKGAATVGKK